MDIRVTSEGVVVFPIHFNIAFNCSLFVLLYNHDAATLCAAPADSPVPLLALTLRLADRGPRGWSSVNNVEFILEINPILSHFLLLLLLLVSKQLWIQTEKHLSLSCVVWTLKIKKNISHTHCFWELLTILMRNLPPFSTPLLSTGVVTGVWGWLNSQDKVQ